MNQVPESKCPNCGAVHNAATSADLSDATPEPGDVSVCFECAAVNCFDDNLALTALNVEELDDETKTAILYAVRSVQRMHKFGLIMPHSES